MDWEHPGTAFTVLVIAVVATLLTAGVVKILDDRSTLVNFQDVAGNPAAYEGAHIQFVALCAAKVKSKASDAVHIVCGDDPSVGLAVIGQAEGSTRDRVWVVCNGVIRHKGRLYYFAVSEFWKEGFTKKLFDGEEDSVEGFNQSATLLLAGYQQGKLAQALVPLTPDGLVARQP